MTNNSLIKLVSDIERDLLFNIIWNMRREKISAEDAQILAKDFITVLPVNNRPKLFNKLKELSNTYPEARIVFLKYATPYEERRRRKKIQRVRRKLKETMEMRAA